MADQEDTKKQKSSLSNEELDRLAVIFRESVKSSKEDTAALATALAAAIADARKPYVSPQDIANREANKKSNRDQEAKKKAQEAYTQSTCPHVKGSNPSSFRSDPYDSAVAKHMLDTGEVIGVCTNCIKVFSSLNPEDYKYLTAKSTNQTSMAGRREFSDANAAKRARLGLDQKEIFVDSEGNLIDHDPKKKEKALA